MYVIRTSLFFFLRMTTSLGFRALLRNVTVQTVLHEL